MYATNMSAHNNMYVATYTTTTASSITITSTTTASSITITSTTTASCHNRG